jgi:putative ABC transport system permease protein
MVPDGTLPETAYADGVDATARSLAAEALTARELATELARSVSGLIGLFDVLALIAVAIAGLGIVNTLTVGVHERVREIAILRAHGMTAGQVQAMVVVEATILGVVAAVVAATAGVAVAWALAVMGGDGLLAGGPGLPIWHVASVLILGTLVAAAAAIYPARLAARLPIARVTQYE